MSFDPASSVKDLQARKLAAPNTARIKGEGGIKGKSSILLQERHKIHFHTFLPHLANSSSHPLLQSHVAGSVSTWVFLARGKTMFQC